METKIIDIKLDKRFYAVAAYGQQNVTSSTLFYFGEDATMYKEPQEVIPSRIGLTINKVRNNGYDPFAVVVQTETTIIKPNRVLED